MNRLGFLFSLMVPSLVICGHYIVAYSGSSWGYSLTPFFVLGLLPIADQFVGLDKRNPLPEQEAALVADPFYYNLLRAFVPLTSLVLIWGHGA